MNEITQRAYEGLIRRSAQSHKYFPFMLKGSFLTRQYFPLHIERKPQDLDWVCLEPLVDRHDAKNHLKEWIHHLTTVELNDEIRYTSFSKDNFGWELDYVMSEDFPTVNTHISAWVNGQETELSIDVSFNLEIKDIDEGLTFHPLFGHDFKLLQTPSLATQIAWKLHQCMVNPRYKDIFDLTYLLRHLSFADIFAQLSAVEVLKAECERDGILLSDHLSASKLILPEARRTLAQHWKGERLRFNFTDLTNIPESFESFWNDFTRALIDSELLECIDQ